MPRALTDFEPWEVSLVDRPANRRPFVLIKHEGGETQMELTDEVKALFDEIGFDPEKLAATSKEDVAKAVAAIEKAAEDAGVEHDDESESSVVHKALDVMGKLLEKLGVSKAAGDGDKPKDDDKPAEDPRIAELQKRVDAQDKELAEERETARVAKAVADLDTAVAEKRIIPAVRDLIRPVVEHLAKREVMHVSKAEDGKDVEAPMLELVVKALEHDAKVTNALFTEIGATGASDAGDAWKDYERAGAAKPSGGNDDGNK